MLAMLEGQELPMPPTLSGPSTRRPAETDPEADAEAA
jgi:hypothetical protein